MQGANNHKFCCFVVCDELNTSEGECDPWRHFLHGVLVYDSTKWKASCGTSYVNSCCARDQTGGKTTFNTCKRGNVPPVEHNRWTKIMTMATQQFLSSAFTAQHQSRATPDKWTFGKLIAELCNQPEVEQGSASSQKWFTATHCKGWIWLLGTKQTRLDFKWTITLQLSV